MSLEDNLAAGILLLCQEQKAAEASVLTQETSSPTLASCLCQRAWAEIRPHNLGLSSAFADVVQIHPLHGYTGGQAEIRDEGGVSLDASAKTIFMLFACLCIVHGSQAAKKSQDHLA